MHKKKACRKEIYINIREMLLTWWWGLMRATVVGDWTMVQAVRTQQSLQARSMWQPSFNMNLNQVHNSSHPHLQSKSCFLIFVDLLAPCFTSLNGFIPLLYLCTNMLWLINRNTTTQHMHQIHVQLVCEHGNWVST